MRPHRQQPTRLPCPWDSPGKNTGVGCHFLLQCMKVKSESEGAQSCLTLRDPMDCSPPGSSVHGIFQARVLEWGAITFSGMVLYLDANPLVSFGSWHVMQRSCHSLQPGSDLLPGLWCSFLKVILYKWTWKPSWLDDATIHFLCMCVCFLFPWSWLRTQMQLFENSFAFYTQRQNTGSFLF